MIEVARVWLLPPTRLIWNDSVYMRSLGDHLTLWWIWLDFGFIFLVLGFGMYIFTTRLCVHLYLLHIGWILLLPLNRVVSLDDGCWVPFREVVNPIYYRVDTAAMIELMIMITRTNNSRKVRKIDTGSWQRWLQWRGGRIFICKRPVSLDDHLQEGRPSGWSFARGRFLQIIICICKRRIFRIIIC